MAFYDFAVTITAGTTKATPKEQELELTQGIIHRVEIEFPAGCRGYAYLAIDHYKHQLFPSARDNAFNGEGYVIGFDEHYPLLKAPYNLVARGWAPDATYNHTITVRVGILTEEELEPLKELPEQFQKFFKLLGVKV